jgi:hypothetical protein
MVEKIKKFLKTIWKEFVYGGHLLSLGAVNILTIGKELKMIELKKRLIKYDQTGNSKKTSRASKQNCQRISTRKNYHFWFLGLGKTRSG